MKYTITVKPTDPKGDLDFFYVDHREAVSIKERWDAHQNIQIGGKYISWQRIVEIEAPPKHLAIEAPTWCVKCENGWTFSGDGALPCSCNKKGIEDVREYRDYLSNQPWGKANV